MWILYALFKLRLQLLLPKGICQRYCHLLNTFNRTGRACYEISHPTVWGTKTLSCELVWASHCMVTQFGFDQDCVYCMLFLGLQHISSYDMFLACEMLRWWNRFKWGLLDVSSVVFGLESSPLTLTKFTVSDMCASGQPVCVSTWCQCDVGSSDAVHRQVSQWDVEWWDPNSYPTIFGQWWSAMSFNFLTWKLLMCCFLFPCFPLVQVAIFPVAWSKVCRLWFYCMGFRADWKAMVALFNLERNYNVNEDWVWKR